MGLFDASSLPSSPTSQSIATSGIAPWAQPYINSFLNRAQALTNAGTPSPFQSQVYTSAQNMGMPEQFAMGTSLANRGGEGALSTAPTALAYGQQGANIGQQGVGLGGLGMSYGMGAGQNYAAQATNPYAVGAYMNPYIQNALAPQMQLLNQQQQLAAQNIAAKAAGQGAFGGNRATLAQGLNAQNYDLARQQAAGQAYNQAFQQAQQAQQFGAQLGLQGAMQGTGLGLQGLATAMQGQQVGLQGVSGAQQGYQGATQAGAALGNIGAQQGQYELAKLALQNQIANQQYNQPYQNLQFMQGMMSGLPISSQTTQGYQAPPNALSQMVGLGSTVVGGIGALNKAGAFDAVKNWWNSGGSGGGGIPFGGDARDIGLAETSLSGASYADLPYDVIAKGGQITSTGVKRYADGGSVDRPDGTVWSETQEKWVQPGPNSGAMPSPIAGGIGDLVGGVSKTSPVTSDELSNIYHQYLGRGVDASGAKSFTGLDRTSVLNAIMNSPEYQARGVSVPGAPMTGNTLFNAGGKGDQLGMLGRIMGSSLRRQPNMGNDLATLQLNRLLGTAA